MNIPEEVESIINRLQKSEDEWKALYMASWNYSYQIKAQYMDIEPTKVPVVAGSSSTSFVTSVDRNQLSIELMLPESKKGIHIFKIQDLYDILISRDGQFTFGHLQTLFSLFEELLKTVASEIYQIKIDAGNFDGIKDFFKINDFRNVVTDPVILKELKLAKETRNCFIHRGSKIDKRWVDAYGDARRKVPSGKMGKRLEEGFKSPFHQIEDWHVLIVDLSKAIREVLVIKE